MRTGLLVLHGNRLEDLAATVFAWLAAHPLPPLEQESFLAQSNGMAEWLKMELAAAHGVCAATRVELPARFIWRAYRAVLGRAAVPAVSALDKLPLTWRLMKLLPKLARQRGFEPVAGFLGQGAGDGDGDGDSDGDPSRRLQLAQRLADLFDQYQVYRSDWLQDWAGGQDRLRHALSDAIGATSPMPADQQWQPALWRAVRDTLEPEQRHTARAELHQRFLQALQQASLWPTMPGLPRRLVLFGTTHLPHQTLEAIAALSAHCQVLMAVPNPCRYHWADSLDGRELLRAQRRRQPLREGRDLAQVPLQDMHAHGHPLLSAWGRQARDFVRQLDVFDDVQAARQRFDIARVDLFDDAPGANLLQQVQAAVRDLVPLREHAHVPVAADDRSIVFHVAHSAQREVEILHDQLLHLFAHAPAGRALNPRDVVVMVPDIDSFAPAIRSVFGQHTRGDARFIPWGIADQRERRHNPLLVALEWLLRAPQQRFTATELLGLLEVPAVAHRFGLGEGDLALLQSWIADAGVRWGLHEAQRTTLGLQACGDTNSWAFGLRRMLLGYAVGDLPQHDGAEGGFAGIEPFAEVAGLAAGLAGTLAELLAALQAWWMDSVQARAPAAWGERLRALIPALFAAQDEAERATLAALDDALAGWLQACEAAAFDDRVDLAVVREAWLDAVDEPGLAQRFKAGGVTFCTLLPLRAIPFEVVCLLGMNDGDYPRRSTRSDFDLMGLPGQARAGDRSRRDDDRQLMLDALLSARRVLYLSWAGRSQRDNQAQPPSVLVAQLRDYLDAGWGEAVVQARTTEHPLQPFSRAYFEGRGGLFTYAAEWRGAFGEPTHDAAHGVATAAVAADTAAATAVLTLDELTRFLRNPVKGFFRRRLGVVFDEPEAQAEDDEPFESGGLDRWRQINAVLQEARRQFDEEPGDGLRLQTLLQAQVARLQRAGSLPLAGPGAQARDVLQQTLRPMLAQWQREVAAWPQLLPTQALQLAHPLRPGLRLDDRLVGLRSAANDGAVAWIELRAGKLADKKRTRVLADKLLPAWLRLLAASACGLPLGAVLVGSDVVVRLQPAGPPAEARGVLAGLMEAWLDQAQAPQPLPTAVRTGLAWLNDPSKAASAYDGTQGRFGEREDECLARLFPDFEALAAQPGFEPATRQLYGAFHAWAGSTQVAFKLLPGAATGAAPDDEDADG